MPQTVLCYTLCYTLWDGGPIQSVVRVLGMRVLWAVFLSSNTNKHGVGWGVGWGGKKTQQHSQGFPHALGFMPHIVPTGVGSDFPSPCANPAPVASVEKTNS